MSSKSDSYVPIKAHWPLVDEFFIYFEIISVKGGSSVLDSIATSKNLPPDLSECLIYIYENWSMKYGPHKYAIKTFQCIKNDPCKYSGFH